MSTSFGPGNSRETTGPVRTGVPGPGRPGSSPDALVLAVPPVEERRKSTPKNAFNRSPRSSKSPSYSAGSDLGVMISIDMFVGLLSFKLEHPHLVIYLHIQTRPKTSFGS